LYNKAYEKISEDGLSLALAVVAFGAQAQTQTQLNKDLADLRAWMSRKANQADSVTQAEWPNLSREFKARTASLDRNVNRLSAESKQEYSSLKGKYQEWEKRNETRKAVDLDGQELERWERDLTGTTHIAKIKAAALRDAFNRLLTYTREHRRTWSLRDWDYAEFVFGELNTRKSEVLDNLDNSDKIKIAALQVEFATLQKSREAKDAYETMREQR
jgi:hypothetical protein